MSQINVNPTQDHVEPVDSGDRTAAAGINLITVLVVLVVLAVVAWYLFTGPLRAMSTGGSTTINVQNPAPTVNVNPSQPQAPTQPQAPSQPQAPAPGGNPGGGTGTGNSGTGSTGGTNP